MTERVDLTGESGDLPVEVAAELLRDALRLDSCCAEAWFRQSFVAFAETEDPVEALDAAIASAALHRTACGAWINAMILAFETGQDDQLIEGILRTAYRFNGDEFVQELTSSVAHHPRRVEILALLDSVIGAADADVRRGGFVLRLRGDDGEAAEFMFLAADE